MDQTRKFYSIPALLGMTIFLLTVPVAASDSATVSLVPEGVSERVVLTVSGPGDLSFKTTFEAGSTPSFELFNQDGNPYRDGSYTWELRSAPARATKTRDQDDRGIDKSARKDALASGYFAISDGGFVAPDRNEEVRTKNVDVPTKDQQILDDLIVDGSLCVGQDCVNGESFGFDTLRLKENNLRIRAVDTSSTSSFPSRDWQITFNDSSNGGANKFSIDDIDGGRTPFTIEAGAPSHSLYVDDGGRVGFGTSTPVTDLHVKSGNTPTLRLEQDGSSGFTPQTWDVAGNETNMFIRDATNGSTLPFRIFPGAPSNALNIEASGEVGLGTTSPQDALEVRGSDQTGIRIVNTTNDTDGWGFRVTNGDEFRISKQSIAGAEFILDASGNVTIKGYLIAQNGDGSSDLPGDQFPDYVFESDYELMPLADLAAFVGREKHLPNVPSAVEINAQGGINMTQLQLRLLEKIEELTLYTLDQQQTIEELREEMNALKQGEVR